MSIQRVIRGFVCSSAFGKARRCAITIQTRFRATRAHALFVGDVRAVTMVQALQRKRMARAVLLRSVEAASNITGAWRCYSARAFFSELRHATIMVQAWMRSRRAKHDMDKHRAATIVLQSAVRRLAASMRLRLSICAATKIQALVRTASAKHGLRLAVSSCTKVQSRFRMMIASARFQVLVASAVSCQRFIRCVMARNGFRNAVAASVGIQTRWRVCSAVLMRLRSLNAVTRIQAQWRSLMDSLEYNQMKNAQLTIMKWWVNVLVLRARQSNAIVILQSKCRCWMLHHQFKKQRSAAVAVQRFCLSWVSSLTPVERDVFVKLRECTVAMQKRLRVRRKLRKMVGALATLQRVARGFMGRSRSRNLLHAILRLQSRYRGKVVRVRANRNRRIMAVRAKMAAAAARAAANPELRLGNRTKAALYTLQQAKMLTHVLKACTNLEISTRLSPPCCRAFAAGGATGVLLRLVRTCNRSTPHQELLRSILSTLNFVSMRGKDLCNDMIKIGDITPELAVEVLSDLVQNFRDKEPIFCLAVGLLCRISSADESFRVACGSADTRKRLNGVVGIVSRKLMLVKKDAATNNSRASRRSSAPAISFPQTPKTLLEGCNQLEKLLKQ